MNQLFWVMWLTGVAESLNKSNLKQALFWIDSFYDHEKFLVTRLVQFVFDYVGETACLKLETS